MQRFANTIAILASYLPGRYELLLIISVMLILFLSKKPPPIARSLRHASAEAFRHFIDEINNIAGGAGKSLGGIYGKRGAQALTPDNQTAELYDPAFLRGKRDPHDRRRFRRWMQSMSQALRDLYRRLKNIW